MASNDDFLEALRGARDLVAGWETPLPEANPLRGIPDFETQTVPSAVADRAIADAVPPEPKMTPSSIFPSIPFLGEPKPVTGGTAFSPVTGKVLKGGDAPKAAPMGSKPTVTVPNPFAGAAQLEPSTEEALAPLPEVPGVSVIPPRKDERAQPDAYPTPHQLFAPEPRLLSDVQKEQDKAAKAKEAGKPVPEAGPVEPPHGAKGPTKGPGLFGERLGILSKDEQDKWVKDTQEQNVPKIQEAQANVEKMQQFLAAGVGYFGGKLDPQLREAIEGNIAAEKKRLGDLQKQVEYAKGVENGTLPPPTKSALRSGTEGGIQAFTDVLAAAPVKYAGIIAGYVDNKLLSGDDPKDNMVYRLGENISDFAKRAFPSDPARQYEFGQKLSQGVGSLAGFYGAGGVSVVARLGPKALYKIAARFPEYAGVASGGVQEFEAATQAMEEGKPVSENQRLAAMLIGSGVGATESIPVMHTLKASKGTSPAARLTSILEGGTEEFLQEGGSQIAYDIGAKQTYDPERKIGETAGEQALIGMLLGSGARAGRVGYDIAKEKIAGKPEETPPAPVEPATEAPAPEDAAPAPQPAAPAPEDGKAVDTLAPKQKETLAEIVDSEGEGFLELPDGVETPEQIAEFLRTRATRNKPVKVEKPEDLDVAGLSVNPEPTEAQKEAGNYRMAHVKVAGLDVSIENPAGTERKGVDEEGRAWSTKMPAHYGYIKRTEAADGDHVDVFVGEKLDAPNVTIVDQIDPKTGKYDEPKVMVGFADEAAAVTAYKAAYSDDKDRVGAVSTVPLDEFKSWLKDGDTSKPFAELAGNRETEAPAEAAAAPVTFKAAKGVGEETAAPAPAEKKAPAEPVAAGAEPAVKSMSAMPSRLRKQRETAAQQTDPRLDLNQQIESAGYKAEASGEDFSDLTITDKDGKAIGGFDYVKSINRGSDKIRYRWSFKEQRGTAQDLDEAAARLRDAISADQNAPVEAAPAPRAEAQKQPLPDKVPSFQAMRKALPKDENGDYNTAMLAEHIKARYNADSWASLSDEQRRETYADLSAPKETAVSAKESAKEKATEASGYVYRPLTDTDNYQGRVFYHGTKSQIDKLSDTDVFGFANAEGLYGIGLYLTDNPAIAESYATRKGKGGPGKVLAGKLSDVKLIDLEKPLPKDAAKVFETALKEYMSAAKAKAVSKKSGKEAFFAYRSSMAEKNVATEDALEQLQNLAVDLGSLGYDGLRHEGIPLVKSSNLGPHNVVILFENAGYKDGVRVGKGIQENLTDVPYDPDAPYQQPAAQPIATVEEKAGALRASAKGADGKEIGYVSGTIKGDTLVIDKSTLQSSEHRKGHGLAMYKALIDEALKRGMTVESAYEVSEQAARVYESLKRRGYNVQVNPYAIKEVSGGRRHAVPDKVGDKPFIVRAEGVEAPAQVAVPADETALKAEKVPALKAKAAELGIPKFKSMSKAKLIEAILKKQAETVESAPEVAPEVVPEAASEFVRRRTLDQIESDLSAIDRELPQRLAPLTKKRKALQADLNKLEVGTEEYLAKSAEFDANESQIEQIKGEFSESRSRWETAKKAESSDAELGRLLEDYAEKTKKHNEIVDEAERFATENNLEGDDIDEKLESADFNVRRKAQILEDKLQASLKDVQAASRAIDARRDEVRIQTFAERGAASREKGPRWPEAYSALPSRRRAELGGQVAAGTTAQRNEEIRSAYLDLSGGDYARRVRIADIAKKLPNIPLDQLHEDLLRMQGERKLVLYTLDDPMQITPADRKAAVKIGDAERHIIYMENFSPPAPETTGGDRWPKAYSALPSRRRAERAERERVSSETGPVTTKSSVERKRARLRELSDKWIARAQDSREFADYVYETDADGNVTGRKKDITEILRLRDEVEADWKEANALTGSMGGVDNPADPGAGRPDSGMMQIYLGTIQGVIDKFASNPQGKKILEASQEKLRGNEDMRDLKAVAERKRELSAQVMLRAAAITGNGNVKKEVVDGALAHLAKVRGIIPKDFNVGVLVSARKLTDEDKIPGKYYTPDHVVMEYMDSNGDIHSDILSSSLISTSRAFSHFPSNPGEKGRVIFVRTTESGSLERLRGELWHESIHTLRDAGLIPADSWSRLLAHAKALKILEMNQNEFMRKIGVPADYVNVSLLDAYKNSNRSIKKTKKTVDEEYVAHMVELYSHGALSEEDIAPVKDDIDAIVSGDIARKYEEDSKDAQDNRSETASASDEAIPADVAADRRSQVDDASMASLESQIAEDFTGGDREAARTALEAKLDEFGALNSVKAALAGQSAQTADITALSRAADLAAQGFSPTQIWERTGWYQGSDGGWRFEVDDSQTSIKPGALKARVNPRTGQEVQTFDGKLGDLIDAENVFRAYPDLRDIPVVINDRLPSGAAAGIDLDNLRISIRSGVSEDAILDALTHEVQHAIQVKEEFDTGGNRLTMSSRLQTALFEVDQQIKTARPGSNIVGELRKIRASIEAQMAWVETGLGDYATEGEFDAYNRLRGEVEARNAAARRKMTAEERARQMPTMSEDVPEAEQFSGKELVTLLPKDSAKIDDATKRMMDGWPNMAESFGEDYSQPFSIDISDIRGKQSNINRSLQFTPEGFAENIKRFGIVAVRNAVADVEPHMERRAQEERERAKDTPEWASDHDAQAAAYDRAARNVRIAVDALDGLVADHPEWANKLPYEKRQIDPNNLIDGYNGRKFTPDERDSIKSNVTQAIRNAGETGLIDADVAETLAFNFEAQGIGRGEFSIDASHPDEFAKIYAENKKAIDEYKLANAYVQYARARGAIFDTYAMMDPAVREPSYEERVFYRPRVAYALNGRATPVNAFGRAYEEFYDGWAGMEPDFKRFMLNKNIGYLERKLGAFGAWAQRTRQTYQDGFLPVRRFQEATERDHQVILPDGMRPYMKEELHHGRIQTRLEDFQRKFVEPFADDLAKSGIELESLEMYLYAKHAEERNKQIASINPKLPDGGSGMTTADANTILGGIAQFGRQADYDRLAQRIYDINKAKLQLRVDYGLMKPDEVRRLQSTYKNYVPLKGDPQHKTGGTPSRVNLPRGFSVSNKDMMRALGRASRAENLIARTLLDYQESVIRGERNRVGQAFFEALKAYPMPHLAVADTPKVKRFLDTRTGLIATLPAHMTPASPAAFKGVVRTQADPLSFLDPNVMSVMINGDRHTIRFENDNLRDAIMYMAPSSMRGIMRAVHAVNRWIGSMATALNPGFPLPNFIRDFQAAGINLVASGKKSAFRRIAKNSAMAMKSIAMVEAGRGSGPMADLYRELKRVGGTTGFYSLKDWEQSHRALERDIKLLRSGRFSPRKMLDRVKKGFVNVVGGINNIFENATRLAAYKMALEEGLSTDHAASIAKNITVNFNRRGSLDTTAAQFVSAGFLFVNPSIQGTVRLAQAFKNAPPRRRYAILGTMVAMGGLSALYNALIGALLADDEEKNLYSQTTEYDRANNWMIMNPFAGRQTGVAGRNPVAIKFPMPYGYGSVVNLGRIGMEYALSHNTDLLGEPKSLGQTMGEAISIMHGQFNPMGSHPNLLVAFSPTIAKPFMEMATNVKFTGGPVYPKAFDETDPDFTLAWRTTPKIFRDLAKGINTMTGGDQYRKGEFMGVPMDFSPETFKHLTMFGIGGLGNEVMRMYTMGERMFSTKEPIKINDIPIIRRFAQGEMGYSYGNDFYEIRDSQMKPYEDARRAAARGSAEARSLLPSFELSKRIYRSYKRADVALKNISGSLKDIDAKHDAGKLDKDSWATKQQDLYDRRQLTQMRFLVDYNAERQLITLDRDPAAPAEKAKARNIIQRRRRQAHASISSIESSIKGGTLHGAPPAASSSDRLQNLVNKLREQGGILSPLAGGAE